MEKAGWSAGRPGALFVRPYNANKEVLNAKHRLLSPSTSEVDEAGRLVACRVLQLRPRKKGARRAFSSRFAPRISYAFMDKQEKRAGFSFGAGRAWEGLQEP